VVYVECHRGNGSLWNSNFSLMMTSTTMLGISGGVGGSAWSSSGDRHIESRLGPDNSDNSASSVNTDVNGVLGETLVGSPVRSSFDVMVFLQPNGV